MAKIIYEIYQNGNSKSTSYGRAFARAKSVEVMNLRKLAKHIIDHGSPYTEDVVLGVMTKATSCILEMLLNSKKVKLDGLGTFYTTIANTRGGADTPEAYNVNKHIKGLHIRFQPSREQESNLASGDFLKKAEFLHVYQMQEPAAGSTKSEKDD